MQLSVSDVLPKRWPRAVDESALQIVMEPTYCGAEKGRRDLCPQRHRPPAMDQAQRLACRVISNCRRADREARVPGPLLEVSGSLPYLLGIMRTVSTFTGVQLSMGRSRTTPTSSLAEREAGAINEPRLPRY